LGKIPKHWEVRRHFGLFDEHKEVNHPDKEAGFVEQEVFF
jgi:hypothetical protein